MARNCSKVVLLTANVGSIFEDPEKMLPIWLREFLTTVTVLEPEFLAIHCQEVGGKNYEESMQHVNKFIKMLLASDEMQQFDRARVFLDEDFTAVEKFTALGSLYFIHQTVKAVEIFDFHEKRFVPVDGKEVLSGNIEHVRIKEKAKFAKDFFPDSVWSRKGFIRTRWNLYNTVFDLVNIHLFHDVSNIAAMETSPSVYSTFRERALLHTVDRFETDEFDKVPFFMFGDFNFRLDTNLLVQNLTAQTEEQRVTGKKNDISKVIFRQRDNGKIVLTVGKKDFRHCNHNDLFSSQKAMMLKKYDQEPEVCRQKLFEYDVTFPPSYPFSEDTEDGTSYMPTRCPGWCDRIMMSHNALNLMVLDNKAPPDYKMIGAYICMGDHKPIYLNLKIRHRTGNDDLDSGPEAPLEAQDALVQMKSPVKQVISINGETVEAACLDQINIHDFTTFEQEDLLTNVFIDTIKRRSGSHASDVGAGAGAKSTRSFKKVARSVMRTEKFLDAFRKHYSHRSDSEPDSEDDDKHSSGTRCSILAAATLPIVSAVIHTQSAGDVAAYTPEDGATDGTADDELNTNTNNNSALNESLFVGDVRGANQVAPLSDVSIEPPNGAGITCDRNSSLAKDSAPKTESKGLPPNATSPPPSSSAGAGRPECGCCRMQ